MKSGPGNCPGVTLMLNFDFSSAFSSALGMVGMGVTVNFDACSRCVLNDRNRKNWSLFCMAKADAGFVMNAERDSRYSLRGSDQSADCSLKAGME